MPRQSTHLTCQPQRCANRTLPLQRAPSGISSLIEKFEVLSFHSKGSTRMRSPFKMPPEESRERKAAVPILTWNGKTIFGDKISGDTISSIHQDAFITPSETRKKMFTQPHSSIWHQSNSQHTPHTEKARGDFPDFPCNSGLQNSKVATNAQNKMSNDNNNQTIKEKVRFFEKCRMNSAAFCKFHHLPGIFTDIFLPW